MEEVSVTVSEWEMQSMLKALGHWNKDLFRKLKVGLIDEAIKEGYEISWILPPVKMKCPNCKEEIDL